MSTVACPVKMMTCVSGLICRIWPRTSIPVNPGILQVEQGRIVQTALEGLECGGPVGTNRHLVSHPRQLHLHEVAEVGLIVGEQDPQSSLTRLFHIWVPS